MPIPGTTTTGRRRLTHRLLYGFLAFVLGAPIGLAATALPAAADPGDPEYLQIDKSISSDDLTAGDQFTYTIQVTCSESDCVNATVDDAFPAELEGFPISNVSFSPSPSVVPRTVTWNPGGTATAPATFGPDTALHVDLQEDFPAGVGLGEGSTFTITITSQVPDDYPPGIVEFTNTASTTADNAQPVDSSVPATITVPREIAVDVSKSWSPESSTWGPGTESTISLGITNASNGGVETLTLQEPQAAADGATSLDDSNPFVLNDFAGFGDSTLPEGCDSVQVDAYVFDGTAWSWTVGVPGSEPVLPGGVENGDVGGLRIICTGENIPQDATGSFDLQLSQRETDRNTDESFETQTRVTENTVAGEAGVEGMDPATDTADATHTIVPVEISAAASKDITPSRIAAGDTAQATISGTNTSSDSVQELRVSDLDYFTAEVTFGGFTSVPTWPATATAAQVIYYPLGGGDPEVVDFADGEIPAAPSADISGFEIVYTADGDDIASGSRSTIEFTIATDPDMAADADVATSNEVVATVTTESGRDASASDDDDLTIVTPEIVVDLSKSVLPSSPVEPGEDVVTSLTATTSAQSEFVDPSEIVVTDVWDGAADGFWNAFDLTGVAPTQVPPDTTLEIEVYVNGAWVSVQTFPSQDTPRTVQLSQAQIEAAIAPATIEDVTGIQFTFTSDDTFPAGTTVQPNFISEARSDLRDGSGATTPGPEQPTVYTNTATTQGTGVTPGGQELTGDDTDTGEATIETEEGTGPIGIDKQWNQPTISSQSSEQASTTLLWEVDEGFETVTITDPANPEAGDSPEETVFQAFDLVEVNSIAASSTPFSNGWWLRYDTISAVELYDGSDWVTVPEPGGGWISNGAFVGYELSAAERESTIGVRIVLEENTAAREAAAQSGPAFDPYAPEPGTGVGASSSDRTFDLTWQIRDTTRIGGEFVTGDDLYNTEDIGVVDNTVRLDGTPIDGDPVTDVDDDTILILDQPPAVGVEKSVSPDELLVPPAGSPTASYPTAQFEITGHNDSVTRASYVRLTDPAPCGDGALSDCTTPNTAADATADPFAGVTDWTQFGSSGNPFDRFDIEDITIAASEADEVDLDATTVWLLTYAGGTFDTVETTAAAVNAGDVDLADVVGISVAFQGSDPATTGGTITPDNELSITIDTRVRSTIRSTGEDQALDPNDTIDVNNLVFAQSYDPVTAPEDALAADNAEDSTVLSGGTIDVGASKSVDPTQLIEPTRDEPVTVTLGADSGTSTLSPVTVTLEDQASSPEFWNAFDFTGLGTITPPTGADQVQVDLYGPFGDDGELGWAEGTPGAVGSPTLPVSESSYPDVQGIRFTFSASDGGLFSDVLPAPAWTTTAELTVQLRDEYRDGSGAIPMEGSVPNTVTTQSNGALASSEEATADAEVDLSPGTQELSVNKLANNGTHFATPGAATPFRLQFENSGTGYLTITEVRDLLPAQLVYLTDPATIITPDPDGTLSENVTITQEGQELVFTWPEGENVMQPGELFEITVYLELQPVNAGTQVTNTLVVQTEEELESCSNIVNGGRTTGDWASDPTTCGTTDYVEPAPGPNLFTVKAVRGELDGAVNPTNPRATCRTITTTAGESFYRSPCAANSVVGGTDSWLMFVSNAGTTGIDTMTVFDQLPIQGDQRLVDGQSRGSQYKPEVVANSLDVAAPAGTTYVLEVTESPNVCRGTWATVQTATPCAQNGEVWTEVEPGADIDWSDVTGVRVTLNFRTATGGALQPGQRVEVTWDTVNVPASDDAPGGADTATPMDDQYAWNQFGIKYHSVGENMNRKIAPAVVGTHLLYGPIEVSKEVTGTAAQYAAESFDVDVVCAIEGTEIDLGDESTVTLSEDNDYTYRIDGIPVGVNPGDSQCTLTESGDVGEFGETSREGTPVTLSVDIPAVAGEPVPEAQLATITNVYDATGLSVTKLVDTLATAGEFGPFEFTLTCESITGIPVTFDDEDSTELTFTVAENETFTAPEERIPVGATCLLTETDSASADGIVFVGDNVTDNGDGTATVVPGVEPAAIEVTNAYDAGVLEIAKVVDGEGAELYGTGSFTFDVVCTWEGDVVLEESYDIEGGGTQTIGPLPVDTSCAVTETATGGATSSTLSPEGDIVIEAPGEGEEISTATLTATNTFDVAALTVTKQVAGYTTGGGATGEFTVLLECTWTVDGEEQLVEIPGGAERTLSAEGTVTYDDLPVGASCVLEETVTGEAESTTIEIDGETESGTTAAVELDSTDGAAALLTNTFATPPPTPTPAPTPTPTTPPTTGGGGGELPPTGSDVAGLVALAGLLLAVGLAVLAERRRRHGETS